MNESKTLRWAGSCRKDLKDFPKPVQRLIGQALFAAQNSEEFPSVKALKGFGGRSVLEIVAPFDGDTWRTVYTVRFRDVIYVLHAFQKKSKQGRVTPKKEIEMIRRRLMEAERDHKQRLN